VVLLNK